MKTKIAFLCVVTGSFLLGFSFYFGMIYFPFRIFTEISDISLTLISVIVAMIISILNFRSVYSFILQLLSGFFRFDKSF